VHIVFGQGRGLNYSYEMWEFDLEGQQQSELKREATGGKLKMLNRNGR